MATRTVRLDAESERILRDLRDATGLSVSQALKHGLVAAQQIRLAEAAELPFEIYRTLDLGAGGTTRGSARTAKASVRRLLAQKRGR